MQVRLSQPRSDCLVVERGRRWRRFVFAAVGVVAGGVAVALVPLDTAFGLVGLLSLAPVLAVLAVVMARAIRPATWTLVRTQGRLLIDGEPLEMARVELRVDQMPVTKVPTGYTLSLWVMTASGPVDIPLGSYRTLIDASLVSGTVEDFVQRANVKQPGHTGA
ncbi:MAG: hypothetical protein MUC96_06705 [Myxococcaceae bacterium]|jgi:acyl-coenzyme A thioesterase PaaI-like protein|nr:hypothetical protein [Myxococcaceae bacterium]